MFANSGSILPFFWSDQRLKSVATSSALVMLTVVPIKDSKGWMNNILNWLYCIAVILLLNKKKNKIPIHSVVKQKMDTT